MYHTVVEVQWDVPCVSVSMPSFVSRGRTHTSLPKDTNSCRNQSITLQGQGLHEGRHPVGHQVHKVPHLVPSQLPLPVRQALLRALHHLEVRPTAAAAPTAAERHYSALSSVAWHEGVVNITTRVEAVPVLRIQALARGQGATYPGGGVIMLIKDVVGLRDRKGKQYAC